MDKELAQTGAKREEMLEVDDDHNNLSVVPIPSPFFDRLVLFLGVITEQAPAAVASLLLQLGTNDGFPLGKERIRTVQAHPKRDFSPSTRAIRLPAFLPSNNTSNKDFFGRQDILNQIDEAFGLGDGHGHPTDTGSLRTFVLCGLGGIGKTEIAVEYMFSRKQNFDVILWLVADTEAKLSAGVVRISRTLGLEDSSAQIDKIASRDSIKKCLSQPKNAVIRGDGPPTEEEVSWLIVFDNVDELEILHDYWPTDRAGCVIITSRNPLAMDGILAPSAGSDVPSFAIDEDGRALQPLSRRENET